MDRQVHAVYDSSWQTAGPRRPLPRPKSVQSDRLPDTMNSFRFSTRKINTRRYQSRAVRRERVLAGGYHPRVVRRERIHAGGYHARMGLREILTAIVLCAAIFACSFAIGRDASTTSAPRE